MQSYSNGGQIVMPRNTIYSSSFFHTPALDSITFQGTSDVNTLIAGFRAGQFDLADDLSPLTDIAKTLDLPTLVVSPAASSEMMYFDERAVAPNASSNGGASIFADPNVRKAFILAFNRCTTVTGLLAIDCRDGNVATTQVLTSPFPEYDTKVTLPDEAVFTAQSLMDAAGYQVVNGHRTYHDGVTPITLSLPVTPRRAAQADLLAAQWQANLQITVNVSLIPPGTLFAPFNSGGTLATGQWDITSFANNSTDPDAAYTPFVQSDQIPSPTDFGFNEAGISDPQIDALLQQGRTATTAAGRKAAYSSLATYLTSQSDLLPLYMLPDVVLAKATIGNYKSHPLFINTWNAADWFLA